MRSGMLLSAAAISQRLSSAARCQNSLRDEDVAAKYRSSDHNWYGRCEDWEGTTATGCECTTIAVLMLPTLNCPLCAAAGMQTSSPLRTDLLVGTSAEAEMLRGFLPSKDAVLRLWRSSK